LRSSHFYDNEVQNAQLKSPVNFVASLIREYGLEYTSFDPTDPPDGPLDRNGVKTFTDPNPTLTQITLQSAGSLLGQMLLHPPNVKGWPGGHNWISTGTFQNRENISNDFLSNIYNGSQNRNYVSIQFKDAVKWAQSVPNYDSLKSKEFSAALTSMILNRTLGPLESESAYKGFNSLGLPEDDFYLDENSLKSFALFLSQLPEFQLV
jgi:hypothetical protein